MTEKLMKKLIVRPLSFSERLEEEKPHRLTIVTQGCKDADVLNFKAKERERIAKNKSKEEARKAKKPLTQKLPLDGLKIAA